jgi:anti-anti-sigma regulatory factor
MIGNLHVTDSSDDMLPPLFVLQQNRVVVIRLSPANFFNDLHCFDVGQLTAELIRQCPSQRVVMDLAAVQSAGSNFIGMLTGLAKESRRVESELGVANLSPALAMTFRIACVSKSVKLFASLKEATTAAARRLSPELLPEAAKERGELEQDGMEQDGVAQN